jgi:hypothetical protein
MKLQPMAVLIDSAARINSKLTLLTGQNRAALESLKQAERYRDPVRQKLLSSSLVVDPGLVVLSYKIWTLLSLGLHDQAARAREQALLEMRSHNHAFTVANSTFFVVVWPEFLLGDLDACERCSAELVAYCTEKQVAQFRLFGLISRACARAMREPTHVNVAALRGAIETAHRAGAHALDSAFISSLAGALLGAGDVGGAEAALRDAFAFVEQSGERFWLAELHRLDGQIALKRPEPDRALAEACFFEAIDIARSQEARLLELRAATDLAGLWRETGSHNNPHALLEPVLAAIEPGGNTRDVRNARALLAAIA